MMSTFRGIFGLNSLESLILDVRPEKEHLGHHWDCNAFNVFFNILSCFIVLGRHRYGVKGLHEEVVLDDDWVVLPPG